MGWQHNCMTSQRNISPHAGYFPAEANTYRDEQMLRVRFADYIAQYPDYLDQIDYDSLNGTAAHNWYVHLEHTLNKLAAGLSLDDQIDDYSNYTRLINVAWSGDVARYNYMDAEDHATEAGTRLAKVIVQLVDAGISTNIMAHSLGNRVLLTVMNILGQQPKYKDALEHVFMWQPAVPDTALSNDPQSDTSILRNWNFIHAHKAAKKIVVLHSEQDNVLGPHTTASHLVRDIEELDIAEIAGVLGSSYKIATQVGDAPLSGDFSEKMLGIVKGHTLNKIREDAENIEAFLAEIKKDDLFSSGGIKPEDLSPQAHEFFMPILYVHRLEYEAAKIYCKSIRAVAKATINTEFKDVEPRPAMGHTGPELEDDSFVRGLRDNGKLIIVDQSKWLFSHSGMKVPSEDLYEFVYNDEIMEKMKGAGGFGAY